MYTVYQTILDQCSVNIYNSKDVLVQIHTTEHRF